MEVLLISGLGPSSLENEDRIGSYMDENIDKDMFRNIYQVNSANYWPDKLYFYGKNGKIPVLRKSSNLPPDLITCTLCGILHQDNIAHRYISIENIWSKKKMTTKSDIVCLSTSFMWSEKMLDEALNWVCDNISFTYLIVGGQYSTLKKEYLLSYHKIIDFLITGDAELSLSQLINTIVSVKLQTVFTKPYTPPVRTRSRAKGCPNHRRISCSIAFLKETSHNKTGAIRLL